MKLISNLIQALIIDSIADLLDFQAGGVLCLLHTEDSPPTQEFIAPSEIQKSTLQIVQLCFEMPSFILHVNPNVTARKHRFMVCVVQE